MTLLDFFSRRSDGRAEPLATPQIEPMAEPAQKPGLRKGGIAAATLAAILAAVYVNEGGYVNDPADPGGATNYGVTERVARREGYSGHMRDFPKHCPGVASAEVCADNIYVKRYIEDPGYMPMVEIEPAVAKELVDSAVNFGPPRPSGWFQQSLNDLAGAGLKVDRSVGPRTIGAYRALQQMKGKTIACVMMLDALDARQADEYRRLVRVNPRLRKFYKGWMNHRVGNVDRKLCGKGML